MLFLFQYFVSFHFILFYFITFHNVKFPVYRRNYIHDVLTERERTNYNSAVLSSLIALTMDGYESDTIERTQKIPFSKPTSTSENRKSRTSGKSDVNTVSNYTVSNIPSVSSPWLPLPGSLINNFDLLNSICTMAKSSSSFLIQISCRLVYAALKANPLNMVILEAFGVIDSMYVTLADIVLTGRKYAINGTYDISGNDCDFNTNNCEISEKTNEEKNYYKTDDVHNVNNVSNVRNKNKESRMAPTTDNYLDSSSSSGSSSSSSACTNEEFMTKKMVGVREVRSEMSSKIPALKPYNSLDLIPLLIDVSSVLQYGAVITSLRSDSFLQFIIQMIVTLSLSLSSPFPSRPPPSSSSTSSSSVTDNGHHFNETVLLFPDLNTSHRHLIHNGLSHIIAHKIESQTDVVQTDFRAEMIWTLLTITGGIVDDRAVSKI